MARAAKFLQQIRASLATITSPSFSPISRSRIQCYGKFEPLKSWMNGLRPALYNRTLNSQSKLYTQRCLMPNFCESGRKFCTWSLFGVSVALGSISLWPRIAYSMDGIDILVDDNQVALYGASDLGDDSGTLLVLARKLWLPVFLILTVLMNWGHPYILAAKVVLILLSTKPSPFSVYLCVEQLRRQSMHQRPVLYQFKHVLLCSPCMPRKLKLKTTHFSAWLELN